MSEALTEILLAKVGRQWEEKGETIATYGYGSIVFLPKGIQPGERVRVVLEEIREDSCGRMMYRGRPAPTEIIARWQERDGVLELIETMVDWKLRETSIQSKERRAPVQREVPGPVTTQWQVIWGATLEESYLERTVEKIFFTENESVQAGKLVWTRGSERRETGALEMLLMKDIFEITSSSWRPSGLPVVYPATTKVGLRIQVEEGGGISSLDRSEAWGSLPVWLQAVLLDEYPVCCCGRRRLDRKNPPSDGYSKCQMCRDEESCTRCGATPNEKPLDVKIVAGALVCQLCVNMMSLEVMVTPIFTQTRRACIGRDAARLLSMKALPSDVGQLVFEGGLDHIHDSVARSSLVTASARFAWFYIAANGAIEASRFAPEALEVLQYIANATGNGLVRVASWFVDDMYERTQVRGESVALNGYTLSQLTYASDSAFVVAYQLRGSEADRIKLIDEYNRLSSVLGEDVEELREAGGALRGELQDYAGALTKLRSAESAYQRKLAEKAREAAVRKNLTNLIRQHYPSCPFCGKTVVWKDEDLVDQVAVYSVCECLHEDPSVELARKALGSGWGANETTFDGRTTKLLRRTTARGEDLSEAVVAELVAYHKYGQWNLSLILHPDSYARGKWHTADLWRCPSEKALELFTLERLEVSYPEQVKDAEMRSENEDGLKKLTFRRKTNDRSGQLEWVAGQRQDGVIYIVDRRYEKVIKKDGETHFCYLDRCLVDTPAFKLYLVRPFLQVGRDIKKEADAAREEMKGCKATDEAVQQAASALAARFNKRR